MSKIESFIDSLHDDIPVINTTNKKLKELPDLSIFKNLKELPDLSIFKNLNCKLPNLNCELTLIQNLNCKLPNLNCKLVKLNCELTLTPSVTLYMIREKVNILTKFRFLYYHLKFKSKFINWLWELVRKPKAEKQYHPDNLQTLIDEGGNFEEILEKWCGFNIS
jgi:hypothetical protein